ncbi:MAG: class II fructose-bisphosphate aldolase [Clostridiales bacterium]|jgi:fructose-bisphosphate aldolase class II|nr:class II fructose-bisphosphate aldolase [Clostridiales bacterium]
MALVNTKKMLEKAFINKYAIGAFNVNNLETVQAVMRAAKKNNSHVILQISQGTIKYAGIKYLINIVNESIKETDLDIALHLDHGFDFEIIKSTIENGFSSIMFDGSSLSYQDNIRLTKKFCAMAHEKNITIEAELGKLAGIEDEIKVSNKDASYTDPEQALDFIKKTGIDSLAVSIGTSHGAYKFKGEAKLDFDRLNLISNMLEDSGIKNFPIVLHGASSIDKNYVNLCNKFGGKLSNASGVPEEILKKASRLSICKINIDTDLRIAMTSSIRKSFFENPENIDPRNYLSEARDSLENVVNYKIKNILGSKGSCSVNNVN